MVHLAKLDRHLNENYNSLWSTVSIRYITVTAVTVSLTECLCKKTFTQFVTIKVNCTNALIKIQTVLNDRSGKNLTVNQQFVPRTVTQSNAYGNW